VEAVLIFGSNLGDREALIREAVSRMEVIGPRLRQSSLYETAPWGFESPHSFLNQVVTYSTDWSPHAILRHCLNTETLLGRQRGTARYSSRTIDIDILLLDTLIINTPDLIIPHPRLHLRNFVLIPLAEILPNFIHPLLQQSISFLLINSNDSSDCHRY